MTGEGRDRHGSLPPTVEFPYWRWRDGSRAAFREVALRVCEEQTAELGEVHAGRIAELMRAGLRANRIGQEAEARRLMSAAARLCVEPTGQFPGSAVVVDS